MMPDDEWVPSKTWRETAARGDDEVEAIAERWAVPRSAQTAMRDIPALLREIDRLRRVASLWELSASAQMHAAEDMRRRAVEVCRAEAARREEAAGRHWGMDPNVERFEAEIADRLADEIEALSLIDGETGE